MIQATLASANNAALPRTITAVLTWNGTATTFTYSTSGDAPGDPLTIAAQVPSAVTTTGRYPWKLEVIVAGQLDQTVTGATFVVAEDASPFGAGWTFGLTDQLVSIPYDSVNNLPAGMLRVYGTGGWAFYPGTTTFTSPADDPGVLTLSGASTPTPRRTARPRRSTAPARRRRRRAPTARRRCNSATAAAS